MGDKRDAGKEGGKEGRDHSYLCHFSGACSQDLVASVPPFPSIKCLHLRGRDAAVGRPGEENVGGGESPVP